MDVRGGLVSVLIVKGMHLRAASRHLFETQGCHRFDVPLCQWICCIRSLHSQFTRRVVSLRSCSLCFFLHEEEHHGLIFAEACYAKSEA